MTRKQHPAALAVLAALALIGSGASVVAAVAPGNDSSASPTEIQSIPFSDSLSTLDATSETGDPDACVFNGHTVWYEYAANDTQDLRVDTFGSSYDTVAHVAVSDGQGGLTIVGCNDDAGGTLQSAVRFTAEAGTTYLIVIGSFADEPGGDLVVHLDLAPPPLEISLTVDPTGSFDRYGRATVSGTIACSTEASFVDAFVELSQRVGRFRIRGFGETFLDQCGPTPSPWVIDILSPDGKFAGGRASADVSAFSCSDECSDAFADVTVQLRN